MMMDVFKSDTVLCYRILSVTHSSPGTLDYTSEYLLSPMIQESCFLALFLADVSYTL